MNLNREQFLRAVERGRGLLKELKLDYPELKLRPVFSRFGPCAGQCDLTTDLKKIVIEFPEILVEGSFNRERTQGAQKNDVQSLREHLFSIRGAEKEGEKKKTSNLWKEVDGVESRLLIPDLKLYSGDVLIEYRCGVLKYESLRRLQVDARLPSELNAVGNLRVVAGSLEMLGVK